MARSCRALARGQNTSHLNWRPLSATSSASPSEAEGASPATSRVSPSTTSASLPEEEGASQLIGGSYRWASCGVVVVIGVPRSISGGFYRDPLMLPLVRFPETPHREGVLVAAPLIVSRRLGLKAPVWHVAHTAEPVHRRPIVRWSTGI